MDENPIWYDFAIFDMILLHRKIMAFLFVKLKKLYCLLFYELI